MDWQIDHVVSVTDGDTIRAMLSRDEPLDNGLRHKVYTENPKGDPLRLVHLDTPERGQTGYYEARDDVRFWLDAHPWLRVATPYKDSLSRRVADIYVAGDRADTLSQWMVLERGWPVWLG